VLLVDIVAITLGGLSDGLLRLQPRIRAMTRARTPSGPSRRCLPRR